MDKCRAALILSAYLNLTIQKVLINADEHGFGTANRVRGPHSSVLRHCYSPLLDNINDLKQCSVSM